MAPPREPAAGTSRAGSPVAVCPRPRVPRPRLGGGGRHATTPPDGHHVLQHLAPAPWPRRGLQPVPPCPQRQSNPASSASPAAPRTAPRPERPSRRTLGRSGIVRTTGRLTGGAAAGDLRERSRRGRSGRHEDAPRAPGVQAAQTGSWCTPVSMPSGSSVTPPSGGGRAVDAAVATPWRQVRRSRTPPREAAERSRVRRSWRPGTDVQDGPSSSSSYPRETASVPPRRDIESLDGGNTGLRSTSSRGVDS
jgi:hypothetical protein